EAGELMLPGLPRGMHEVAIAARRVGADDSDSVHEVGDAATVREPEPLKHGPRRAEFTRALAVLHDPIERVSGDGDARASRDRGHLLAEHLCKQIAAEDVDGDENDAEGR